MKEFRILIIDHFDSFTYNLYHYVGEIGSELKNTKLTIRVIRTNISLDNLNFSPTHIILSPGYGHPDNVQCFHDAISLWSGKIPILGICLGHQAIATSSGILVKQNRQIIHGKQSLVYHKNTNIFKGLPNPLSVGRYHSLVVDPNCESKLEILAWTEKNEIMAIRCKKTNMLGVQFHPESILTPAGKQLLKNWLSI